MRRLTLRLPDALHLQLQNVAANEGVPLNQYVVDALTRHVSLAASLQAVPENTILEQRIAYSALLQSLGEKSFEQIQKTLEEREFNTAENELSLEGLLARVTRDNQHPELDTGGQIGKEAE